MPRLGNAKMEQYLPILRQLLVRTARNHLLVKYGSVQNQFGGRGYFGQVLDELNRREHRAGRPLLSALVVLDQPNPMASNGFFIVARELLPASRGLRDRALWEVERNRVWAFAWRD
jgi:hypothetical protein